MRCWCVAPLLRSNRRKRCGCQKPWPGVPGLGRDVQSHYDGTWPQEPQKRKKVYFVNTHFDHVGQTARSESAKLIVQTLQTLDVGLPVILTGDLNDRPVFRVTRP